jgi:hypothetical protein
MSRHTSTDSGPKTEIDLAGEFDASAFIGEIGRREAVRKTGPGTIARRTLDTLAERRRLTRELASLDDYEDS